MEYFKLLNLEKEPFSNSPDPNCFFKSRQHKDCLQKLELSLRLRRGLNVVIGDVGTGKTTLCRQLLKKFSRDEEIETHLILDPHMADPAAFLKYVAQMFTREPDVGIGSWTEYKEFIKKYLYKKGVDEQRIVVLIIDEGQKIPTHILEILRELLNYETNEYKLLQIVIFAQREFEDVLGVHANFADRINLLHTLGPLGFWDTRLMIDYRLQKAGLEGSVSSMLTLMALVAIFRATGGYPRKIVNLCHRVMLAMIVKNKRKAGWRLVRSCVVRKQAKTAGGWQKLAGALIVILILGGAFLALLAPEKLSTAVNTQNFRKVFRISQASGPTTVPAVAAVPVQTQTQRPVEPARTALPATMSSPKKHDVEQPDSAQVPVRSETPAAVPLDTRETAPVTERLPVGTKAQDTVSPTPPVPETVMAKAHAGEPTGDQAESFDSVATALYKPAQTEKAVAAQLPEAVPASPPQSLGSIYMREYEILSWVMIKVYGEYNNQRRREMAVSNPDIRDLDNIFTGQQVNFPARAYKGLNMPDALSWVRVDRVQSIPAALEIVRRDSTQKAPLRIIPHWHRTRGLLFDVIFWKYYPLQSGAKDFQAQLPEQVRRKSEIVPGWAPDTVFYAHPCPGVDHRLN